MIFLKKQSYRLGLLKTWGPPVPVCVIGNITVGGTGKTPVVLALTEYLQKKGMRVGIISRGMGSYSGDGALEVKGDMDPNMAGDETVLLAKRNQAPVFIHKKRVRALHALLSNYECDCVISDDGLQHEALGRMLEIVLVDGVRGLGNGLLLPAGPLREPASRLKQVKWILSRGGQWMDAIPFSIKPLQFRSVLHPEKIFPLDYFSFKKASAIAGIAHPELFFSQLRALNIDIQTHCFDDHARFTARDFEGMKEDIILMTEKDAVKCAFFENENMFYLEISADIPEVTLEAITADLLKSHF